VMKSLRSAGPIREVMEILQRARKEDRETTEEERQRIQVLTSKASATRKPRIFLLKNAAESARLSQRLKHLCRLIARDRYPFIPSNGLFVLLPFAATENDEDANNTGAVLQQDLQTARQALKVHCPMFTLLCDLETAPGFREFLHRFQPELKQRRFGKGLPLMPDLPNDQTVSDLADRGVQWVCHTLIPNHVYR